MMTFDENLIISALDEGDRAAVIDTILKYLPENPPYFPEDQIADRDTRFFVSEFIREEIFLQYREEIPYSSEADIEDFKELDDIIHIQASSEEHTSELH